MSLFDVSGVASLSGGMGAAYATARHAGDGLMVVVPALLFGLVAGIATWAACDRVGEYFLPRSGFGPGYVPTLRTECPAVLLLVAQVVGIVTAVIMTSSLVRIAIHHVA